MTLRPDLRSMAVRVFAVLAVGMSVAAAVGFLISDHERRQLVRTRYQDQIANRVLDVVLRIGKAGSDGGDLPAGVVDIPPLSDHDSDRQVTAALNARLAGTAFRSLDVFRPLPGDCAAPPLRPPLPPLPGQGRQLAPPRPPRLAPGTPEPADCRLVSVTQDEAPARSFMIPTPPPPADGAEPVGLILFYVLIGAALILAFVVATLTTAPIRDLARAAARLGENLDQPPLALKGPSEVRQAAAAFNGMQARIRRTLEDRTFMLAAITHDLQTPLTRQRLRIERLSDPVQREQMLDDYRIMRDLIRDGLEIARGGMTPPALQPLDIASLLESLCEDAVAAGQDVVLVGSTDATVLADPASLQRCLLNLVENAVKYGERARLSARRVDDAVEISVVDDGPGIEAGRLQDAVQPFVRLEKETMTLGTGLGLAIARLLAERNGSPLVLATAPGGGLSASIRLALAP